MSKINEVAADIVKSVDTGNELSATDWIGTVMTVIQNVTALMQSCGLSPAQAANIGQKPSFIQKRILTNSVRRALGWKHFRTHGSDMVNAIIVKGGKMNEVDWSNIFEEV